MVEGIVFDIRKFSIHDGPGIRTAVFLKGCPLQCWWCHNPESISPKPELTFWPDRCTRCAACQPACPHGAITLNGGLPVTDGKECVVCGACAAACYSDARQVVGRRRSVAAVVAEVERDIPFYDESGGGVTISGGEPLRQARFVEAILRACKEKGIHTALDTSGFVAWKVLDRVRPYVDLFLYDLKLMDDARHRRFTGVSNVLILRNLQALSKFGHHIVLRVPLVPGINDDEESLRQLGTFAAALPNVERMDILPYHRMAGDKYDRLNRDYRLPDVQEPSGDRLNEITHALEQYSLTVEVGG